MVLSQFCRSIDAVRYLEDPRQSELFDVFADILSPVAYRRLSQWLAACLSPAILKLMPAEKLAEHFDPQMGRPTKELYSVAGLLFIMEFRNWTHEEATDAYISNIDVQYALNLQLANQSPCRRTIERYTKLFASDWNQVTIEAKQAWLINPRRKEKTAEFRHEYRLRSGIEATNSLLKRVTWRHTKIPDNDTTPSLAPYGSISSR